MAHFYYDASALAKRYSNETGTNLMNFLFTNVPLTRMMCLTLGASEVFWILVRKRNDGRLNESDFSTASMYLNQEVIASDSDFTTISTPDSLVWASLDLVDTHSINSVDAIVLRSALDTANRLRDLGDELVLVAADTRLVRAARSEGLSTFNPETDSQQTLATLIAS